MGVCLRDFPRSLLEFKLNLIQFCVKEDYLSPELQIFFSIMSKEIPSESQIKILHKKVNL